AKMILSNIYFEFDSDELNDRSLEELSRIAEFLKREEHIHVEISGHTDNVGKASYNQGLSERRARAVYTHLTTLKVSPSRMKHTGFGSSQPIATNETTSGQDQNRRIEFKITSLKN
ncbi:MAG: OmpA family protein, partial [Cyclobacteriaceae bacterium]